MAESGYDQIKESKEDYIITKLNQIFGVKTKAGQEKMKKSIMENEENRGFFNMIFLENDSIEQLFVTCSGDQCQVTIEAPNPNKLKKKGVVILKLTQEQITTANIVKDLAFMELPRNVLEHCYMVYHDIISPITQNPLNQQGWTELVSKDLMEKFNSYIAQIYVMIGLGKGRTLLPLPTHKMNQNDTTPDKDKAHVFETSIMTWMKQIKNVLKLEPEMALKQKQDPGPLTELDFWENKMNNLNSIYEQLQSPEVQSILRFLEDNKSTYTKPFDKIQNQVRQARIEANDNSRYLKSLKQEFIYISEGGKEFVDIHEYFYPIVHKIYMIWKKSKFYNTPPRLVVLIREICNAIIAKARDFISGNAIFMLIQAEETAEASEKLQTTIDICSEFKAAYFCYKQKANQEWKLTTNALFSRLDSFMDRCEDISHLTKTIVQFNKLSKIELGGTKGKTLTETVQLIYNEFLEAVEAFQAVKYDIMDIDVKEFDDDYYEFRSKIKELERRLASVITQGFDDQDTIYGRFKLLDSFDGLLTRPIIQDELEKKHIVLLESYKADLKIVQSIFLEGKQQVDSMDEKAPIFNNLPPIAGALTWCNGLQERIKEPLDKLSTLGQVIVDREEYKDVQKLYASITKSIQEYEQSKILAWEKEVQANSQEKLKQSLLYKNENGLLKVNFDPALTRLLREVKYFQLLGLQVPPMAAEIFEKNDTFRQQIISLDLIVQNYNEIITSLHPVEEPLVKERIEKIDECLKPGLDELKWKSQKIDQFIGEVKLVVDSTYEIVQKMKDSLTKIKGCLEKINSQIVEKKLRTRPMPPDEYDSIHKAQYQAKMQLIKENGIMAGKLLKEVLDAVKIERKSPMWLAYLQYVNEIVLDGIAKVICTALSYLNDQIDPVNIKKQELVSIFEIRLELGERDVIYDPIIEETSHIPSVRNYIKGWIQDYFLICNLIHRLDINDASDYLVEVRDFFELKEQMALINDKLDWLENETNQFKEKYRAYNEFWLNDPQEFFNIFLEDNEPTEEIVEIESPSKQGPEIGGNVHQLSPEENPLLMGARAKVPKMTLFDEKIMNLKQKQAEIQRITPPSVEIGWIKINLQPLKTDLDLKVTQWIRVYTEFLKNQVKISLKNLKDFISKTNDGIKNNPSDEENIGNKAMLMSVMKIISDVKDVDPTIKGVVTRIKDMVMILKKNQESLNDKNEEDPVQVIDNYHNLFNETTQKVFKVRADILPLQVEESQNIKKKLNEFKDQVDQFRQEFLDNCPYKYNENFRISDIQDSYYVIQKYYKKLQAIQAEQQEFSNLEKLFELEKRDYRPLRDCHADLKNLKLLWDSIAIVNYQYKSWKQMPFTTIKADLLSDQNKMLQLQLKGLPKEIKNMGTPYNAITDKVKNMAVVLPLVSLLHSESMEQRHWDQLMTLTGRKFDHNSVNFNFEEVLELHLHKHENAINELVEISQKEQKIEKKLKAIESSWNKQVFEFDEVVIDEDNITKVFLPLDNMMEIMDAHTMDLMNMRSQGKNVEFFLGQVNEWRDKLNKVDAVVNEWLKVQKNWRMLVNIFLKSEDIKQQLANETQIFKDVDKEFREMMDLVYMQPAIIENCTQERLEVLKKMNSSIRQCEKSLNDYLEQKKKVFPRFYFLSNQNLLTILSNGNNLPKVCEFLGDCFDGLKTLIFAPAKAGQEFSKVGLGMISKDGEIVNFEVPFEASGPVENYLNDLEFKMRETLHLILENAKQTSELWDNNEKPRDEWLFEYNAQIALLTTQIVWTDDVTRAFDELGAGSENAMKDCKTLIDERIESLIKQVRRTDLPILDRMKIINVITIDVHGRDQVESYVVNKIQELESFAWLSQLKFYFENKESDMSSRQTLRYPWEQEKSRMKCIVRILDWHRFYSYEYVGNSIRLVVTQLTDRCYITLTQALNLNMGGAPAGPAGTGKTETTKDLGRGVGLYVVVFNCSDQQDKDFMANIFMGLSQSGTWGCFDEFNRISPEVLSVISSQVSCVLDALKEKKTKFLFMEDGEISLQDTVGFFITMNPGYAGRSELPENLKALFRSCAMVVPDLIPICENMLMSEGFSSAKELSKKFVTLYKLSADLLSFQKHYDWGLRAVKSVLRQAGIIKRADLHIPENDLLMRALRDFNIPKIVYDDEKIFLRLISDLFPGCDCPTKLDAQLQKAAKETAKNTLGLLDEKQFIVKVVNLNEILQVRHCCFILGSPGCGKTTVWNTLLNTFKAMGQDGEHDTLNPKAVDNSELLGFYTKTKEWKNGVLSNIIKVQSKCEDRYKESHQHKWTILDGDIDPDWIESLNTVMDDNKTLTLISSDRIALTASMRLLFEISNLRNATPATVSRAGVLYIDEKEIGWGPFMNCWLERSQDNARNVDDDESGKPRLRVKIDDIAKSVFYRCFNSYIETNPDLPKIKYIAPIYEIAKIQSLCCILDALLKEEENNIKQLAEEHQRTAYEALFVFAGMWAYGGSVGGGQDDEKDQKDFSSLWKAASKIKFPEQGQCFDYFYDVKNMTWAPWNSKIEDYVAPEFGETINFDNIFVPNLASTRLTFLMDKHLTMKKPMMFIGNAGTGKTAMVQEFLKKTQSDKVEYQTINFNSFTDAATLQRQIWTLMAKKTGKIYGSATQKTLIYFIDDLNMPETDGWGTQSPIELLNQIVNYGSIFNREFLEERFFLEDLLFFGSLNQKAGQFVINQRLQRHFSAFTMYTPSQETIKQVYGNILAGYLDYFGPKIAPLSSKLIDGTIHLFNKLTRDTRYSPTAKKFHYQFNLREISKVTEGIMFAQPANYKDKTDHMILLWIHECKRVFEDRMINDEDINQFQLYLQEALVQKVGDDSQKVRIFENVPDASPVIFTSFISVHNGGDKQYVEAESLAQLKNVLEEKLQEYNESRNVMNLVLFGQAIQHVSRIVRILELGVGNALLIGVGGSGKQSLAKLSAFICEYEMEQLVVTSSFNLNDLRNILADIYRKVAKPSAPSRIFMLTDSQIKHENFLIPINDMLTQGWISDLFPKDELDALINGVRNEAKGLGVNVNELENLTAFFFQKMRNNLKLILCFSPMGANFRKQSRKFPGIINNTSMDWFHAWPKDALLGVAARFMADVDMPSEEIRMAVVEHMTEVHGSIDDANERFLKLERRHNATTPKSFLELIEFYKKVLFDKRGQIDKQILRYQQGLSILANTREQVEGLQEELKVMMVQVEQQKVETDALIEKVSYESSIAEEEQSIANIEEEKTNEATLAAQKLQRDAELALSEAIPALKRAEAAVNCLKKGHITEMKNLGQPPMMVRVTAKAVMTLMGEKIGYNDDLDKVWKKAGQIMNNPDKFLKSVIGFDGEKIEQSALENTIRIIKDPEVAEKFNPTFMTSQNEAAKYLCSWLVNIIEFNRIFKEVKPLQEMCEAATQELEIKQNQLAIIKEKVRLLNEKVNVLKKSLEEAEAKKAKVEAEANMCLAKLSSAETLVNGLSGENKRWGENVSKLQNNILSIIGDVLLASSFVSYIGAFTASFRLSLWSQTWLPDILQRKIPITNEVTPLLILTSDSQIATWKNEGLRSDQMSLENASIISNCSRWPLLIDPQLQGSIWIKGSLSENLTVISLSNKKWINILIGAIQVGKYVLIEGIQEELDATLDPLLSRQIKKKGNSYVLELGGDPIDYDPKFRLYLMTKLFNPHYRPEVAAQCTIINFIVTESGLQDQLLADVVNIEKAELEEMKSNLVKQQNEFKVILDKLENDLLVTLSEADPATILTKKELIQQLDDTKNRAIEIEKQQIQAKETDIMLNQQREIYRPVANEGALLYFLIISLNYVNHMYQYSLESFYFFFFKAIQRTAVQDDTRIDELIKNIRYTIYQWVSRGLFEKDRITLLTMIIFRLMQKKIIDCPYEATHMEFLIKGTTKSGVENPLDWLPQQLWDNVQGLSCIQEFQSFAQNMEKDAPTRFKDWYNESCPETAKLPLDWKKLDALPFQKLLVLKCLRPDRVNIALQNLISQVLPDGKSFIEMDQKLSFTEILENCINDSELTTPIFFILTAGSDPVKEVIKIAKKRNMEMGKTFFQMALGQGMEELAKRRIDEGFKEGHWVMLQNIHLMSRWLKELEKILDNMLSEAGGGNTQFRLFLSAEPQELVPIGILDRSIKLVQEPPNGLKANMLGAWQYFSKDEIEDKDPKVKSILFALCYFHSTLIERKRFGPKGWNMPYPFNIGDLRDSYLVLNKQFEQNQGGKIPFEDFIYIFGDIMYGGHIVDQLDRDLCKSYLKQLMNPGLFEELELFPFIEGKGFSFKVPSAGGLTYEKYIEYIETTIQQETPLAYGLHPNAEIGFRTNQCTRLFSTLLELQPRDEGGSENSAIRSPTEVAQEMIKYILEEKEIKQKIYNLEEIKNKMDEDNKGPYQNVFLQEIEYMNNLMNEMIRSLEELDQGFKGLLTISDNMEMLINSIMFNKVPTSWTTLAYPSKRGLASWLENMWKRIDQYDNFKEDPLTPAKVIYINRLFNPQSFLTAIKQIIAQKNSQELNKLYIATDVTRRSVEEIEAPAKEGSYVFGFILEGARWDIALQQLEESRPKEMFNLMPVTLCKAQVLVSNEGKEDKSIYACPAYKTEDRGKTFVFMAQLKTRYAPRKWILAGVAILMDVEGVQEELKKK